MNTAINLIMLYINRKQYLFFILKISYKLNKSATLITPQKTKKYILIIDNIIYLKKLREINERTSRYNN